MSVDPRERLVDCADQMVVYACLVGVLCGWREEGDDDIGVFSSAETAPRVCSREHTRKSRDRRVCPGVLLPAIARKIAILGGSLILVV